MTRQRSWARILDNPRARKRLSITEEEFYLLCVLAVGAPNPNARDFWEGQRKRGTMAYLESTLAGKTFINLLMQHGEAKCRAARWYYGYVRWWREERERIDPKPTREMYKRGTAFATLLTIKHQGRRLRLFKVRAKDGIKEKLVLGYMTMLGDTLTFTAYAEVYLDRPTHMSHDLLEVL